MKKQWLSGTMWIMLLMMSFQSAGENTLPPDSGLRQIWEISVAEDLPEGFPPEGLKYPGVFSVSPMECSTTTCYFVLEIGIPREPTEEEKKEFEKEKRLFSWMPVEEAKGVTSASLILAVERSTGKRIWTKKNLATEGEAIHLLSHDRLLIISHTSLPGMPWKRIWEVIDARTGSSLWQMEDLQESLLPSLDSSEFYTIRRDAERKSTFLEARDIATGQVVAADSISPDFTTLFTVDGEVYIQATSGRDVYRVERTAQGLHFERQAITLPAVYHAHAIGQVLHPFRSDSVVVETFYEHDYNLSSYDFKTGKKKWSVSKKDPFYRRFIVEPLKGYACFASSEEGRLWCIRLEDGTQLWSQRYSQTHQFISIGDYLAVLGQVENPRGPSPTYLTFYRPLTGEIVANIPAESIFPDARELPFWGSSIIPAPDGILVLNKAEKRVKYYRVEPQSGLSLPQFESSESKVIPAGGSGFFRSPIWQVKYEDLGLTTDEKWRYWISSMNCLDSHCLLVFARSRQREIPYEQRFGKPIPGKYMSWPTLENAISTLVFLDSETGKNLWRIEQLPIASPTVLTLPNNQIMLSWVEVISGYDPQKPRQYLPDRALVIDAKEGKIVHFLRPREGKIFFPSESSKILYFTDIHIGSPEEGKKYAVWAYRLEDGALFGHFLLTDPEVTFFSVDGQPYLYEESSQKVYTISASEKDGIVVTPDSHSLPHRISGMVSWSSYWFPSDCVKLRLPASPEDNKDSSLPKMPVFNCLNWKTGELKEIPPEQDTVKRMWLMEQGERKRKSPYNLQVKDTWTSDGERGATYEVVDPTGLVIWKESLKNASVYEPFGPLLIYLTQGTKQATKVGDDPFRSYTKIWYSTLLHLVDLRSGSLVDVLEIPKERWDIRLYELPDGILINFGDSLAKYTVPIL